MSSSSRLSHYAAFIRPETGISQIGHLDATAGTIQPLRLLSGYPLQNLYQVIEAGPSQIVASGPALPLASVKILPPLAGRDVLAVGKNYMEHAKEFNASGFDSSDKVDRPSHPVIFTKRATSIIADGDDIYLHPEFSKTVDYEGEIGVIVGKAGKAALLCMPILDVSRAVSAKQVQNDLGKTLSKGTLIFGPSNLAFAEATERWSTRSMPKDIQVVIEVAKESDVAKIVKYCYQNSIDFLAYARGHGSSSTISKFQGIEINLSKLTDITIQPDKKSALFQGGVYADLIIDKLWNDGYIAPTGSNGCVGLLGPALGGGLGRYQGQYGLISDNFISLNVVLADGTATTVSAKSKSDLFWAMKGAGHNFGIVTSAYIKIYPRKAGTWHYHNYVWSQDKLERVFKALNKFQGKGEIPALMGVNFGQFSIEPSISKTEAVIIWSFAYDGPAAEAERLLAPFNAIPAISSTKDDVSYPDLLVAQQTDINSASCSSQPYVGSTTWLQTYNFSSQREIYNLFNKKIAQNPGLAPGARVFFEGYSSKATQAIDPGSSSYPHRDEYLLVFFAVAAPPQLETFARAWADKTVDIWYASQPGRRRATYVNYAVGNEPLESIYGYDGQLGRLRALKAKYDPRNKFRWYNPIVTY